MASLYEIKPTFQRLLVPASRVLHGVGVTPNQITAAALAGSVGMGLWLTLAGDRRPALFVMPLFLLLRMAANALDGMIARTYNLCTRNGAVLNEVADVIADAVLYLPFAMVPGVQPVFPVAIVTLAMAAEIAGLAGMCDGGTRRHDGPMGKSDRALAFGILSVLCAVGVRNRAVLRLYMTSMMALLLVTIVKRCRSAGAQGP